MQVFKDKETNVVFNTLIPVDQDESEMVDTSVYRCEGLFSYGFSTCYDVFVTNEIYPFKIGMAHLSSITTETRTIFSELISYVVSNDSKQKDKIKLRIGRSKKTYELSYSSSSDPEGEGMMDPGAYFDKADEEYRVFISKYFGNLKPEFFDIPHDCLAVGSKGNLIFFEGFDRVIHREYICNEHSLSPTNSLQKRM